MPRAASRGSTGSSSSSSSRSTAARSTRSREPRMFSRVLVANRGEIALRVIRALHELGIEAVAVYSTAEPGAAHVRLADEAVCVGPPPAGERYLRLNSMVPAPATPGRAAVHPGYGCLSENPTFVDACVDNVPVFIGPPASVMRAMGDKVAARRASPAAEVATPPATAE